MSMDFKINGLEELIQRLNDSRRKLRQNVAKEMYQFAEEIMTDSKQVVPVLTGALMNTGKVFPPVEDSNSVTVELGYGDESVDYALIVHEELDMSRGSVFGPLRKGAKRIAPHPINWTRPGSGPKYLQNPFDQKSDQLAPRLAKAASDALTK
jgi:hypothetical protein